MAFTAEQLYDCAKFFGDIIGFQAQKLCNAGKHQVPLYLNCYYVTVVIVMLCYVSYCCSELSFTGLETHLYTL